MTEKPIQRITIMRDYFRGFGGVLFPKAVGSPLVMILEGTADEIVDTKLLETLLGEGNSEELVSQLQNSNKYECRIRYEGCVYDINIEPLINLPERCILGPMVLGKRPGT